MAAVRKRPGQQRVDGTVGPDRWVTSWRDPAGKPVTKTFATRREAEAHRNRIGQELDTGSYLDVSRGRVTVREYGEAWRAIQVWRPGTQERVDSVLRNHIYPTFGDHRLAAIRPTHVQAWIKKLEATLAPATVKIVHTNFSSLMKAAVVDEAIRSNPCHGIDLPETHEVEVVPPTVGQVHAIYDHIFGLYRVTVRLASGLGLRSGEVRGLTVDRVDFLRRTVKVDRQAVEVRGAGMGFGPPKTKASNRTIPLPDSVAEDMARHIARYGLGDHGAIVHSEAGRMVRRGQLAAVLHTAVARAAQAGTAMPVAPMRPHHLRHFYASMLIDEGLHPKVIQKRLGHKSITETMDTYGHLWPSSDSQTIDAVDRAMRREA